MCEARPTKRMHLSQRFSCVRSQAASQAFILCNCLCCWPVIPKDLVPDDINEIDDWSPEGLLVCMHDHACKHQVMQVSLLVCQSSHKHGSIAQVMQVSVYICMPKICCKYSISFLCFMSVLAPWQYCWTTTKPLQRSTSLCGASWCPPSMMCIMLASGASCHADKSFISGVPFRVVRVAELCFSENSICSC